MQAACAAFDAPVVLGFLMRATQVMGGLAALVLVATYFTPELQGYHYTFTALTSLQLYIELGFGTVVLQFASHEWADLRFSGSGSVVGNPDSFSRLVSIGRIAFPFYIGMGVILTAVLITAGWALFGAASNANVPWAGPWLVISVLTGMNLWLLPGWLMLEGCNQVAQVYRFRLIESLLTQIFLCLAIVLGVNLWALAIAAFVKVTFGSLYLFIRHPHFLRVFLSRPRGPTINWRADMLPMQWRMSLTWLTGSLLFTIFTPIAFHYQGPAVAGQVGMTLNVTMALSVISLVWITASRPHLGILIAKKDYATLDRVFFQKAVLSLCTGILGAAGILGLVYLLHVTASPIAHRLLPISSTLLFLLASLCLIASGPFGVYLRAHKREPLVHATVASSLLAGVSIWWSGSRFGPLGMATAYFFVTLGSTIVVFIIWHRLREQWHLPEVAPQAEYAG